MYCIIKDSGKFYCLDTAELSKQYAKNKYCVNPHTGNRINREIIQNLTRSNIIL